MADTYADLQRAAAELGTADAERQQVLVERSGPRVREAKKRWTQAIHLIGLALDAAGVDSTQVLGAIRAAQARSGHAAGAEHETEETPSPSAEPPSTEPSSPVPTTP